MFNKTDISKNYKDIARKALVAFLIIQPILDLYMSLFDKYIQIAGVSLATAFRFAFVFALFVFVLSFNLKRRATVIFAIYACLIAIYTVFHHFNAATFSVELEYADYNVLEELLYLARMCIPPAIIYVIYIVKLGYKEIKRIVLYSSLIISTVIITTNLFEVGYIAYSTDKIVIENSMLTWFFGVDPSVNWVELSCRGLFQATNQLSAVLIVLAPVITYICLKEKKAFYWTALAMQLIAMINLSTRVSTIMGLLAVFAVIVIYILEKIIHREFSFKKLLNKNTLSATVSLMIVLLFVVRSPMVLRMGEGDLFDDMAGIPPEIEEGGEEDEVPIDPTDKKAYMIDYIERKLPEAYIFPLYVYESYHYTQDYEFWYDVIKNIPIAERYGNRNMRTLMINRILERDGRASNYVWGISYSRSAGFVWPERDFQTQIDALGVVGTGLFIGPYVVVALFGIWKFFRRFKENLYLDKCIYLITLGVGLVAAYYQGNFMNEVFPALYLAFITGVVWTTCFGHLPIATKESGVKENTLEEVKTDD